MKYALFFCFAVFQVQNCLAWDATQEHQGVRFAKWSLDGLPVWTDADRDQRIVASLVFSSRVLTVIDFSPNLPSQNEIALSSTVFKAIWDGNALWADNLCVCEIKSILTDKKYIRRKVIEFQRQFDEESNIETNFSDSQSQSKLQWLKSVKEFCRRKYQSLP